ncbi:MAG: OmpA family protein [Hydrogenophaga sp.]|uniref:OmpA family protein n=1 Tax=Hydrogenophaga sp. TaxID=1904254 RepID=UPI00275F26F7|nr:OmpA family protein [Hydrogenophaga sp.]MDP2418766.1 OmpA family protein [Hydrogenophaga sp.]MDZ4188050.1 OmpA family protein [Hydrogenophaga sp.]
MKRLRLTSNVLALLALIGLLSACAPATRVTLLPQDDGTPSAVEVTTSQGVQRIDRPYQVANVSASGTISLGTTNAIQLRQTYPDLLALRPPEPERFELKFEQGSSQLTAESQDQLDDVLTRAQARAGGEIVITGHTDRQGSIEANDLLSLQRAQAVRALLVERGFNANLIQAVGRGEREPLVPTADEVAEPRNRRAELLVR